MASEHLPRERLMSYGTRTRLVGILTYAESDRPEQEPTSTCFIVLNAGIVRKVGPSRLNVDMARVIAASGMDTFRFDFAGVGDSPARGDGQSLANGVITDVRETMDHLAKTLGYRRFIVAGLCSGADNGMRAAEQDDRIVGVAMFDPTIDRTARWYWESIKKKLRSTEYLKSIVSLRHPILRRKLGLAVPDSHTDSDDSEEKPELYQVTYADRADITRCLDKLISREVSLFVTFTGSWDFIYNYESQFLDVYSGIGFADKLNLSFRPQADHCFLDREHRHYLMSDLITWCRQFA